MITDLKVKWADRKKNRARLASMGFCSRQYINARLIRSDVIFVDKFFKQPDVKYQCIRVNTSGSITYWYKIEDINHLMSCVHD